MQDPPAKEEVDMLRQLLCIASVTALTTILACSSGDGTGCTTDSDCKGNRVCVEGACEDADAGTSADGSVDTGKDTGTSSGCGELGMVCVSNVLRSCATNAVVYDCATCKWSASSTSTKYNTSCRDQASECSTCDSSHPWTGPGCYFGAGPAVCP
jgi:hypothetical protein